MTEVVRTAGVRDYDVGVFQGLNDFPIARDRLAADPASVVALGDVICHYGLHDVVGVTLLHKHFEIADDELVVREFVDNVSYMTAAGVDRLPALRPYLWKVEIGDARAAWFPLEFCAYPDDLRESADEELRLIAGSTPFLAEFAARLAELDLTETFGLAHLRSRDGLTLDEGETLLETTDEERRILTLRPARPAEVEGLDTTQTLWIYRPAAARTGAVIGGASCAQHCAAHCQAHCTGHRY